MEVINSDHDLENVVEMLDEDEDITDLTRPSTTPQSTKDYFEKSQVRHTLSVLTYPSLTNNAYKKTLNGNKFKITRNDISLSIPSLIKIDLISMSRLEVLQ